MLDTNEVRLPATQAEMAGAATLLGVSQTPRPGFEPPPAANVCVCVCVCSVL